jgi:hypothetical protein
MPIVCAAPPGDFRNGEADEIRMARISVLERASGLQAHAAVARENPVVASALRRTPDPLTTI